METCSKQNKPLLIVADDVDGEALATMVLNKARGILNVCAIKAPGFGDRKIHNLEDIAILTKGTVVAAQKAMKLDKLTADMLGTCRTVTVSQNETIIVDGAGDTEAIKARIEDIKSLYDNFPDFVQNNTRIAGFGSSTQQAIAEHNLILDIAAPAPGIPSMLAALEEYTSRVNGK